MAVFQFESFNKPGFFIRHRDFLGELARDVVGQESDYAFRLVDRGRDDERRPLVSLGAVAPRRYYLRHSQFRLRLDKSSGAADPDFRDDSTFILESGLAVPNERNAVSFQSVNYPGRYIRHRDFHLFVDPLDSPNLALDATFFRTVRFS